MDRAQILERIEELQQINKEFELIFFNDEDEEGMIADIEGAIEEAIFFYKDKLSEIDGSENREQTYAELSNL